MKTTGMTYIIKKLSDELDVHEETIKDELAHLIQKIRSLKNGEDIKLAGLGVFRNQAGRLAYLPDPVLDMEINYEFSGQQPIILAEGSGAFFPVDKSEHDTSKTKGRDEFIDVGKQKTLGEDKKPSDYDALLNEFERDIKPFDDEKKVSGFEFGDDAINVIPDEKPTSSRFGFTDEPELDNSDSFEESENETSEKSAEDQKKDDEVDSKKLDEPKKDEIEIKTPPPLKPEDVHEVGDVISSEKLRKIDDENLFGDEDDKASDELAVEFTTLLKKMRDKAQKASDEPEVFKDESDTKPTESIEKELDSESSKPSETELEKEQEQPEETAKEALIQHEPEAKKEKIEPKKDSLELFKPKDEPYMPGASSKKEEKPAEKNNMNWDRPDHDDNALPSIKAVNSNKESTPKSASPKSDKRDKKGMDTSTIGIIMVAAIILIALILGAYFTGFFTTTTDEPIAETPIERPLLPDNDREDVIGGEQNSDETVQDDPIVTPPDLTEVPREPVPTPSNFEYGERGTFDTNVTDFFGIIIASVSDAASAQRQKEQLENLGYRTHFYSLLLPNGRTTWRIVVGQFENVDDARSVAQNMPAPYRNNFFVTNVKL